MIATPDSELKPSKGDKLAKKKAEKATKEDKGKVKKSDLLIQKLGDRLSELERQFLKFSVETQTALDPLSQLKPQVTNLQTAVSNLKLEFKIFKKMGSEP